ncbi:MAG TPA: SPOR domain-containing protein [Longimicrobiales bacterium]|nr:SPOR domain-containing protein [Longimicrobiales bacterium]
MTGAGLILFAAAILVPGGSLQAAATQVAQARSQRADSARFVVQVRAYEDLPSAEALVSRLSRSGWTATISEGGGYYRVRVGGFESLALAQEVGAGIQAATGTPVWITTRSSAESVVRRQAPQPVRRADSPSRGDEGDESVEASPRAGPSSAVAALAESEPVWRRLSELLDLLRNLEGDTVLAFRPPAPACRAPLAAAADEESLDLRGDAAQGNPGVDLEAGLRSDFVDQPIDEGLPGAYVGLSFELLQAGLLENRKLADVFRVRADQAGVRARLEEVRQANLCWAEVTAPGQVLLQRALLEAKTEAMEELAGLYRRAYLSGVVYLDEVLESEQEVLATRTQLLALPIVDGGGTEVAARFPVVFDLDVDEVVRRIESDDLPEQLLELREAEARLSRDLDDDTRLRFYLRYGIRPDDEGRNRNGVSGGVIFRKPLFQDRDAGLGSELEAGRRRLAAERRERIDATRSAYERFHNQLMRTLRQHYLYLENFERVRRSSAGWMTDPEEVDLGIALNRLTDLYNSATERAAALQELQRAAAQVFVVSGQSFDEALFRPMSLPGPDYRGRRGARALYVWADSFNRFSNAYLLEMLRAKGFQRVLVSAGRNVDQDKLRAFRAQVDASGPVVELMLSNNGWLLGEDRAGVADRVRGLDVGAGGLHLDIEPQALEGFRSQQQERLADYLDVVGRVRGALDPGATLSVSAPIWWPADTYAGLGGVVDQIYLMAYGETDAERLVQRLTPLLRVADPGKFVLALRASDFESEWELDALFDRVSQATGIRSAAVHDLAAFLTLLEQPR